MSTNLQSVLADREYKNWLRAGLSLKYARQGILNLVKNDIDNFHQDLLNGLLAGSQCSNCQIIKTRGVLSIRCPISVCDKIFTAISNEHRYQPAWKNTDCQMWCSNSWQLAKCYMSPGYASKVSAADTDFPGLVSVIINNKKFDNLVNDDMTKTSNIFCQAREVRNTILHKADMRITDTDLAVYIQTLQTMLFNPKCSSTDPDMQNSHAMLKLILNGSLTVTDKDEEEILAEALSAIEKKKQEAVSAVTTQEGLSVAAVNKAGEKANEELESKQQNVVVAIKRIADDSCSETKKVIDHKKRKTLLDISSQKFMSMAAVNKVRVTAEFAVKSKQHDAEIAIKQNADVACRETQKVIEDKQKKALSDISSKQLSSVAAVDKTRVDAEGAVKLKQKYAELAIKQTADDVCRETKKVLDDKQQDVLSAVTSQEAASVAAVNKAGGETVENAEIALKQTSDDACSKTKKILDDKQQDVLSAVTSQEAVSVAAVNKAGVETVENAEIAIKQTSDDACSKTKKILDDKQQDVLSAVTSQEAVSVAAVNKAGIETVKTVENAINQTANDARSESKKALQKHLISTYKEVLSTPLSPMFQIDDVNIEEMYVEPNMRLIDPQREPKDTGVPINSYQDIFQVENKKKIYVLGDAGMGKTSLCNKMVSTWCQVDSKTIDNMSKDQLAMAKFDFLFYVSLRDTVFINRVNEMIEHQLQLERFQDQLPEILENDKCLIILDGLDEWTTENTDARSSSINKGIPGRQGITNCTVLTTTRPSKFEAIQLKNTQIDTKIELLGIEQISSKELIGIMIGFLNAKYDNHKTVDECLIALRDKRLYHFMSIPVIIKQIICLWYFGKDLGKSRGSIYCQMVELLLDLADSRLNEDPDFKMKKEEWNNSKIQLPSCFDDNPKCQLFKPLIVALSNLSFETLISDNQESSLVFNRSQAEFYGLTSADVNICLKIGILSQNKLMVDCNSQMKKVSFLHKTYQDFLAFVFVSMNRSDTAMINNFMKPYELKYFITFMSGVCSETTCKIIDITNGLQNYDHVQNILTDCLREGWCCSHHHKHLQCDAIEIDTEHQPEPLELLCQANIHHMKILTIYSCPTARCLEYLLQVDTLEGLGIWSSSVSSSPISEDNLYSLIHHNTHTLTQLYIVGITLQSRTQLSTLLYNIQHLSGLHIHWTTMSQQLRDSLQSLKEQRPDIDVDIILLRILPDTECTD